MGRAIIFELNSLNPITCLGIPFPLFLLYIFIIPLRFTAYYWRLINENIASCLLVLLSRLVRWSLVINLQILLELIGWWLEIGLLIKFI